MLQCLLGSCLFKEQEEQEESAGLGRENESLRVQLLQVLQVAMMSGSGDTNNGSAWEEEFLDAAEDAIAAPLGEGGEEGTDADHGDASSTSRSAPQQRRERDHHSYLPGPSHPLLNTEPPATLDDETSRDSTLALRRASSLHCPNGNTHTTTETPTTASWTELPILELPGLVLFPGCTIPIRLQKKSWIQHLGRQIDASRRVGSHQFGQRVQFGILLTRQDESFAVHSQQVRRRSSVLRRGVSARNSQRERRISRILQQELLGDIVDGNSNSDDDDDDINDDDNNNNHNRRSTTNNRNRNIHPFVGRVGTIATITYTHGDAVLDQDARSRNNSNNSTNNNSNNNNNSSSSRRRASGVWQQHAEDQTELILQAVGTDRFQVKSYLEFQSFAEVQVFQVQKLQQDNRPLVCPPSSWTGMRRRLPLDPILIDADEDDLDASSSSSSSSQSACRSTIHTKYRVSHHESLIRQLSTVTPIPYVAYQQVWPWRLVGQMVESIENHSQRNRQPTAVHSDDDSHDRVNGESDHSPTSLLMSLAELLQDKETSKVTDDPTQFSFWMASNMPLSVEEKLQLLQVPTTVERLKLLQTHLQKYTQVLPCAVCCSSCRVPLSDVDCVFTVGGAEGTTGNYVNEHGFIHQVVTLQQIDEQEIFCEGASSTDNSYFPGYSWTVTYCQRCGSLLGWKFNWVGLGGTTRRRSSEKNRPDSFFGFMASSLAIESEST